jgi:hypothetical protein
VQTITSTASDNRAFLDLKFGIAIRWRINMLMLPRSR